MAACDDSIVKKFNNSSSTTTTIYLIKYLNFIYSSINNYLFLDFVFVKEHVGNTVSDGINVSTTATNHFTIRNSVLKKRKKRES